MKTGKNGLRLLVLVPHRDARLPLREWGASLFAAGMPAAWVFPGVAPLAALNRPLLAGELKSLARALRQHINENGGALTPGPPVSCSLPAHSGGEDARIFGLSLPVRLPDDFFAPLDEAISRRISPLVIGSSLVLSDLPDNPPPSPSISFRAAALANMICRMKDDGLLEWKIGPLSWLPKK